MKKEPGSSQSRRWQDIRALAIDATFDADRRRVGERVAVVFRWLFLIVLGVLNNVNPHTDANAKVTIDLVLTGWGAMNVIVNVLLAGHAANSASPGRRRFRLRVRSSGRRGARPGYPRRGPRAERP
jgi:hypothetical protein